MELSIITHVQIVEGLAGVIGLLLFRLVVHMVDRKDHIPTLGEVAIAWGMTWILRKISVNAWLLYARTHNHPPHTYAVNL